MEEIWKYIPWYHWKYMISDMWRVKSLLYPTHRILTPQVTAKWYHKVWLYGEDWFKSYRVHRLVMLAFIWESDLEVNHINYVRWDNRLVNLEYVTREENLLHRDNNMDIKRCPCCNQTLKKSRK